MRTNPLYVKTKEGITCFHIVVGYPIKDAVNELKEEGIDVIKASYKKEELN